MMSTLDHSTNSSDESNCYEVGITSATTNAITSGTSVNRPDLLPSRCLSPSILATRDFEASLKNKRERTFSFTKNATKAEPVLRTAQRTIYTAGRPPWYDTQGQSKECFVIGKELIKYLIMTLIF